ncbi:hypothetical protein ASALC70_02988 [Alcanivorax sp. ALC70]|nr:hypothetical protein ASALC70_02988 [Alcanivorax sp. ALC70]
MRCPKCDHPRTAGQTTCDGCGLVFHKYGAYLERQRRLEQSRTPPGPDRRERLKAWLRGLAVPPDSLRRYPAAYALLWLGLAVWGGAQITQNLHELGYQPSVLHNVNLPFHEAGHVVFGVFGRFIGSLGGTLGQLLIPVICGIALLRRPDTFGAAVCLWWFGQNFLDIAPTWRMPAPASCPWWAATTAGPRPTASMTGNSCSAKPACWPGTRRWPPSPSTWGG